MTKATRVKTYSDKYLTQLSEPIDIIIEKIIKEHKIVDNSQIILEIINYYADNPPFLLNGTRIDYIDGFFEIRKDILSFNSTKKAMNEVIRTIKQRRKSVSEEENAIYISGIYSKNLRKNGDRIVINIEKIIDGKNVLLLQLNAELNYSKKSVTIYYKLIIHNLRNEKRAIRLKKSSECPPGEVCGPELLGEQMPSYTIPESPIVMHVNDPDTILNIVKKYTKILPIDIKGLRIINANGFFQISKPIITFKVTESLVLKKTYDMVMKYVGSIYNNLVLMMGVPTGNLIPVKYDRNMGRGNYIETVLYVYFDFMSNKITILQDISSGEYIHVGII